MPYYRRRRYYRRYYRRYKSVGYGVVRVKCESTWHVQYDAQSPGTASIKMKNLTGNNQFMENAAYITIVNSSPSYIALAHLFGKVKFYGFKMEAIPCPINQRGDGGINNFPVYFGLLLGGPDEALIDFNSLSVSNCAMLLNPNTTTTKWCRLMGNWVNTDDASIGASMGKLAVRSSANSSEQSGPQWNVRVSCYVMFKACNA